MKTPKALFFLLPLAFSPMGVPALHAAVVPVVNGTFDISDPSSSTPVDLGSSPSAYIYSNGIGTDQALNYGGGATGPDSASIAGFSGIASVQDLGSHYVSAGAGSSGFFATVDGGGNLSEVLTSTLQADSTYTLSFVAARRTDQFDPSANFTANLYAVPSVGAPILLASTANDTTPLELNTTFTSYTLTYDDTADLTAPVGDTLEINFSNSASSGSHQALVDNVTLDQESTTPEPSTYGLLGFGVMVLALVSRRAKLKA